MARDILDTLALAAATLVAAPIALAGLLVLTRGEFLLGAVFLGLAALVVVFEEYVWTPTDVPIAGVQKLVGVVAEDPEEED